MVTVDICYHISIILCILSNIVCMLYQMLETGVQACVSVSNSMLTRTLLLFTSLFRHLNYIFSHIPSMPSCFQCFLTINYIEKFEYLIVFNLFFIQFFNNYLSFVVYLRIMYLKPTSHNFFTVKCITYATVSEERLK